VKRTGRLKRWVAL